MRYRIYEKEQLIKGLSTLLDRPFIIPKTQHIRGPPFSFLLDFEKGEEHEERF